MLTRWLHGCKGCHYEECSLHYCDISISRNRHIPASLYLPSTAPFMRASAKELQVGDNDVGNGGKKASPRE